MKRFSHSGSPGAICNMKLKRKTKAYLRFLTY